jgi:hypothetical protein
MKHKSLFLIGALVALVCIQLFQGCQLASPTSSSQLVGHPDPLQEEIRNQPVEGQTNGLSTVSPAPVLKYVPLGSSIEEAKKVMESHGFDCSGSDEDALVCKASRNRGLMMAEVIRVILYHEAGKITNVKVGTYLDGP